MPVEAAGGRLSLFDAVSERNRALNKVRYISGCLWAPVLARSTIVFSSGRNRWFIDSFT